MLRSVLLMLLVAGTLVFGDASPAQAQQISNRNPFRSYNISGVNYGSQQWEKEHKKSQTQPQPTVRQRRILIRRR